MTRMATAAEIADHDRDLRKHDTLPHRFDRPISTAIDIAICVRGLKSLTEAAELIEQYAQMVAAIKIAEEAERQLAKLNRKDLSHA